MKIHHKKRFSVFVTVVAQVFNKSELKERDQLFENRSTKQVKLFVFFV